MNLELKVIPVIQVFIALVLMYILEKALPSLSYAFQYSLFVSWLIFALAMVIGLLAVYCFRQHKTTVDPSGPEKASQVVDSGIYAYSRNPMYLALVLVLISVAVYRQNVISFSVIPLFILYITKYQILPEERALTSLFGEEFKAYCLKVKRWL